MKTAHMASALTFAKENVSIPEVQAGYQTTLKNRERALWARAALAEYAETMTNMPVDPCDAETLGATAIHLMTNIQHWCIQSGVNFAEAIDQAMQHFMTEGSTPELLS